jgi:hypothetical protein
MFLKHLGRGSWIGNCDPAACKRLMDGRETAFWRMYAIAKMAIFTSGEERGTLATQTVLGAADGCIWKTRSPTRHSRVAPYVKITGAFADVLTCLGDAEAYIERIPHFSGACWLAVRES